MEPTANPAPVAETAAPVAPAAPAPEAPATPTPTASVAQPPSQPAAPSPEEAAQAAEDAEWDSAAKDMFPGLKSTKKEFGKDGQTKPGEDGKTQKEGAENPTAEKPNAEPGEGNDAKAKGEADTAKDADTIARETRAAARQSAEQTRAVVADVRSKLFADIPTQLQDADGDPINTIEDVQKLINPRTGEAFTEEEAGMWLLSAQQQFNQNLAKMDQQVEQIADTNIALKDEADYINRKYGEILKADPALRDRLWVQYEKTLVKDEASGIITKMPVSLEEFYEVALAPRAEAARAAAPEAPTQTPQQVAQAAAEAKRAADVARQQARADRSDIYSPPTDPKGLDPEDREWAEAANEVFGTNR